LEAIAVLQILCCTDFLSTNSPMRLSDIIFINGSFILTLKLISSYKHSSDKEFLITANLFQWRYPTMNRLILSRSLLVVGAMLLAMVVAVPFQAQALEDKLIIVTSYPKDLTGPFKKAFEAKYPGTMVEVLQKKTSAGVKYIQETAQGNTSDLMWASAPDAFEVLKGDGLLAKYKPKATGIPEKIGSYPINDPDGYYIGFAGSGYGIMWNTRYLKAKKIPVPGEWVDLKKAVYHNHVGMSAPSRSGTTKPFCKARAGIKAGQHGRRLPATSRWSPSAVSVFPKGSTAVILALALLSTFSDFPQKQPDFRLTSFTQR
jgi:hypothetical protein